MTNEELRALAEKARDVMAAYTDGLTGGAAFAAECEIDAAFTALEKALPPARIIALLDANAAMVAALRGILNRADNPASPMFDDVRAALALAEKQP